MSIHLQAAPLPMDIINKAMDIEDLADNTRGVNFKHQTLITDVDLMGNIMENKLLGFKNKRTLNNFLDNGDVYFYRTDAGYIEFAFLGNFPKDDTVMFLNNLSKEYLKRTNQTHLYEEIPLNVQYEEIEPVKPIKKFKISTNMKNEELMNSITRTSYLGYTSREDLLKFMNIGQIIPKKADNDTYDLIFVGDYDKLEAKKYVENLTDEYAALVQEKTYEQVLEKIKERDYSLESEVIDNNDSIILTVNVD